MKNLAWVGLLHHESAMNSKSCAQLSRRSAYLISLRPFQLRVLCWWWRGRQWEEEVTRGWRKWRGSHGKSELESWQEVRKGGGQEVGGARMKVNLRTMD